MMGENDTGTTPWTPNSNLKKYLPEQQSQDMMLGIEGLLDISHSPFKVGPQMQQHVNTDFSSTGSPLRPAGSPVRPSKKARAAPDSPGAALILEAAKATEVSSPSQSTLMSARRLSSFTSDSPDVGMLVESSLGDFVPPSPARTPSRLLYSPRTELPRSSLRNTESPAALLAPYADFSEVAAPGEDLIGSIWKHEEENKRKNANSSARRPLLQAPSAVPEDPDEDFVEPLPKQTPVTAKPAVQRRPKSASKSGSGGEKKKSSSSSSSSVSAASASSPSPSSASSTPSPLSASKKDRKQYSTAGRPRVRGEYKCGKCGHYPKKEKHDCAKELAKKNGGAGAASGASPSAKPSPLRKSNSASRSAR